MSRVEDWLPDFYGKHIVRCPREDWPDAGTEDEETTLLAWRHAFVTRGVEHRFADLVSLDMAADPPRFLSEHLPMIVKLAIELRLREDSGLRDEPAKSREAADAASRNCVDCQGSGLTTRYVAERGANFGFACRCPMGRWIKAQHGPDCRLRDDPHRLPTRRPSEAEVPDIRSPADLRAFMRSLVTSKDAGGPIYRGTRHEAPTRPARALPAHAYLDGAGADPVVERERSARTPREPASAPNLPSDVFAPDDARSVWF